MNFASTDMKPLNPDIAGAQRRRILRLRQVVPVIVSVVAATSLAVLACWGIGGKSLQFKWRGLFVMKANTAVGLLLLAIALLGLWRGTRAWRRTTVACCVAGIVLSLCTVAEYALHVDLGIDQLFFRDFAGVEFPGRTSPATSYGLLMLAIAMLLALSAAEMSVAHAFFFFAAAAPLVAFGGYLYRAPGLIASTKVPIIALHTAVCEIALCFGGILVNPDAGLMRVVVSESLAGSLARRLLPLAIVLPILVGLLILLGEGSGIFSVQFGAALLVSFCTLLFSASVWLATSRLWETEQTRHIAETRRATAELQVSEGEQRLRIAIETARLGTWQLDLNTHELQASPQCKANFGLSAEAPFTEELLFQAMHPEDRVREQSKMKQAVADRTDYAGKYRVVWPDASNHWLVASGRCEYASDNRAIRLIGVSLDDTERVQAEQQIQASQARFRQLAETIPQLAWMARPDGSIFWYNQRWYDYSGTTPQQMEGWGWQSVHDPAVLDSVVTRWKASIQSGAPFDMTFPLKGADGIFRPFLTRVMPFRDEAGQVSLWFGTNTDISEQRRMLQERDELLVSERAARNSAEAASRMKDEFLATLSHELRTPLNAILGWAHILAREPAGGDDLREGISTIERNARAQNQIIEDLLEMSRIISGKLRLDVRTVNLEDVIAAAIDTVQHAADAKEITLRRRIDPQEVQVSGDSNRLQQVFWNLLSNAIKFTRKGGNVEIVLSGAGSFAQIQVIDSGEGIAADFLPYVFDRFRQADASTTRSHGGLGLGLAIVKELVELHGGLVRAISEGHGKGATFVIELPLISRHPQDDPQPGLRNMKLDGQPLPSPARLVPAALSVTKEISGLRVLVVDDEPDARLLVKHILKDHGAIATIAASADEALRLMQSEPFDVLVSDIGMPAMDGYALIERIRTLEKFNGGDIPAIALSAYARTEDRTRALNAGFLLHLAKPFEPAELVAMIVSAAGAAGSIAGAVTGDGSQASRPAERAVL